MRPRGPSWPLCFLCATLLLWPAAAGAGPCAPLDGPGYRVEVAIETPAPSVRRDLSRARLGEKMFHRPNDGVLGMTAWSIETAISRQHNFLVTDGGVCFWLERIRVALRYTSLDVFVASEYGPTSCPYKALLAHEKKHTEVARRHLKSYVEPVRSALGDLAVPRAANPLFAASRDEALAKTDDTLRRLMAPIFQDKRQSMARAQAKVDTPEELRRVRAQCRKW